MEARWIESEAKAMTDEVLRKRVIAAKNSQGITIASLAEKVGVSRSSLSQFANNGVPIREPYRSALIEALEELKAETHSGPVEIRPRKQRLELYETADFREAIGWCRKVVESRRMGVMIGYPGSGKTTVLRRYQELTMGAKYIECWPGMRMGDLLGAIATAAGITISGNTYAKTQQLVNGLRTCQELVLIFDECEYLKKWDVDKFEIIRKIWDNTRVPVIFAGTHELENILTRGGGRGNLAQLYRRKWEIKLEGVQADEIRAILRDYDVSPDAVEMLAKIAVDVRHGGMGNFVEVLAICLEAANGGTIDGAMVQGAKQYKLLY